MELFTRVYQEALSFFKRILFCQRRSSMDKKCHQNGLEISQDTFGRDVNGQGSIFYP